MQAQASVIAACWFAKRIRQYRIGAHDGIDMRGRTRVALVNS